MRDFVILGAPFENGIAMMQRFRRGVLGAAAAPEAILARLPADWPQQMIDLRSPRFRVMPGTLDSPNAVARDNAMTLVGQQAIGAAAADAVAAGRLPITVGGDHSITWPLVRAVAAGRRLGLIYIDAHLDMRPLERHAGVDGLISSGNSFRRILEDDACGVAGRNLVALGIHRGNSLLFEEMLAFAERHGVTVIWDVTCFADPDRAVDLAVRCATDATGGVYLSLDIDAVRAADAPGVSAPADDGFSRPEWLTLVREIARRVPLVGVDLVETSSRSFGWQRLFEDTDVLPPADPAVLDKTATLAAETLIALVEELGA